MKVQVETDYIVCTSYMRHGSSLYCYNCPNIRHSLTAGRPCSGEAGRDPGTTYYLSLPSHLISLITCHKRHIGSIFASTVANLIQFIY